MFVFDKNRSSAEVNSSGKHNLFDDLERLMCEVEFLGGVVLRKVHSTVFYVGR